MSLLNATARTYDGVLRAITPLDGIAPLLLRLILAPVMMQAGWNKLVGFEGTVYWFGNSLGMPFPELMAALAMSAELGGGVLLLDRPRHAHRRCAADGHHAGRRVRRALGQRLACAV